MNNLKRSAGKGRRTVLALIVTVVVAGAVVAVRHFTGGGVGRATASKTIYTCVMHHQIRRDKPGDCPICGMTLVPLERIQAEAGTPSPEAAGGKPGARTIRYWANPMNPDQHSDKPMKDDMGMDYVPVYQEEGAEGPGSGASPGIQGMVPVHLSPYKEQLIGVRFATVQRAPVTRTIQTTGRFAGGEGDFADLAADFAAERPIRPGGGRYVVADVYALDIPFVKPGQKAWVSPLSGAGPKVAGKVARIYPYDNTQSRVIRVRINLSQGVPNEIFANVEIEASTDPLTAVPPGAVMDTGTRQYVFVETAPGTFEPRAVTTGFHGDDLWEVTSGLKPGDRVVDGANFMIDADSKLEAAFTDGN